MDVLVVSIHADLEFAQTPCPERLANGRDFVNGGAKVRREGGLCRLLALAGSVAI